MKSIRYVDNCKSAERFANEWTPVAGTITHDTSDNSYRILSTTGYAWLLSSKNRLPRHDKYRVKFKVKLMAEYAGFFIVSLNVEGGYSRGILAVANSGIGDDTKWAWCQGSGMVIPYSATTNWTDGNWHDIEIILWGNKAWSLFIDNVAYFNHWVPSAPEFQAWAFTSHIAFTVYKADVKVKDIEISNLNIDDYPGSTTPIEIVEVGNRRFLCEKLFEDATKDTPPDMSRWTNTGDTAPTADLVNNCYNLEDVTDADFKQSSCERDVYLHGMDNLLFKATCHFQADDTGADDIVHGQVGMSSGTQDFYWRAYQTQHHLQKRALNGALAYTLTDAGTYPNGKGPFTISVACYNNILTCHQSQDDKIWEWPYMTACKAAAMSDPVKFRLWARHLAGKKCHLHISDIYLYRIISEVVP